MSPINAKACIELGKYYVKNNDERNAQKIVDDYYHSIQLSKRDQDSFTFIEDDNLMILQQADIYFMKRDFHKLLTCLKTFVSPTFLASFQQKRVPTVQAKNNKDDQKANNQEAEESTNEKSKKKRKSSSKKRKISSKTTKPNSSKTTKMNSGKEKDPNMLQLSEHEIIDISNQVALEEGDELLFKYSQVGPKYVRKTRAISKQENEKKDFFLRTFATRVLKYGSILLKDDDYGEVKTLLELLKPIEDRPAIANSQNQMRYKFFLLLCSLYYHDYQNAFTHIRFLLRNKPKISILWRLFAFIISKSSHLHSNSISRVLQYVSSITNERGDENSLFGLTMFGCLLLTEGQYHRALKCFFLVYSNSLHSSCTFVCLYIGICCISNAMDHGTYNRHYIILLGFSFLFKYYNSRSNKMEANYNLARAFQHLGLDNHALPFYEKVLKNVNYSCSSELSGRNYVPFAAHNLALIYQKNGADELARQILKRYSTF